MAFDYKNGMGSRGPTSTAGGAKSSQSGADLIKNIRAGIRLGTVKTK